MTFSKLAFALTTLIGVARSATPKVELYMEALCPYCRTFETEVLDVLVESGFFDSGVELDLIPSGNVRMNPYTQKYDCQHGPDECALNQALACAIDFQGSLGAWPFIRCMSERATDGKPSQVIQQCAELAGWPNPSEIIDCAEGEKGAELAEAARIRTESLSPTKQFVPWVTVNGQPLLVFYEATHQVACAIQQAHERSSLCEKPYYELGYGSGMNTAGKVCAQSDGQLPVVPLVLPSSNQNSITKEQ